MQVTLSTTFPDVSVCAHLLTQHVFTCTFPKFCEKNNIYIYITKDNISVDDDLHKFYME